MNSRDTSVSRSVRSRSQTPSKVTFNTQPELSNKTSNKLEGRKSMLQASNSSSYYIVFGNIRQYEQFEKYEANSSGWTGHFDTVAWSCSYYTSLSYKCNCMGILYHAFWLFWVKNAANKSRSNYSYCCPSQMRKKVNVLDT